MAVEESGRPRAGEEEETFKFHTGVIRPSQVPDAIEFVEVYKSFGRNHVLRGLNMGLPEGQISMIIGPSGTGKSVCIKHIVGLLYPDEGDVIVQGQSIPSLRDAELFELRRKFGVLSQREGNVVVQVERAEQRAVLKQHAELSAQLEQLGVAQAGD